MPTPTYTLIDSVTLASSASSVTFSSLDTIAAGYRDLVLVVTGTASTNTFYRFRFNSDSTNTNYTYVQMIGTGTDALSAAVNDANAGSLTTAESNSLIQIMDFAQTDKHKSYLYRNNFTSVRAAAGRWSNTAAITSIQLAINTGTFNAGSTLSIYGIAA